ncbi:MAG: PAS domain S-box protein, partial [Planctomycetota bacterium]
MADTSSAGASGPLSRSSDLRAGASADPDGPSPLVSINVGGGIEAFREDLREVLGVEPARELVARSIARSAEDLVHKAMEGGMVPPGEEGLAVVLALLGTRGFGKLSVTEHDWDEGWLAVECEGAFEARVQLGRGGPTSEPRCDFTRGVLLGSYRYLRRRAGLPGDGMQAVETQCAAQGHPVCRFALSRPETLAARGVEHGTVELTSRQELEELLRKSRQGESQLRKAFDDMPFGVVELDLEGRITFANRKVLELHGASLSRIRGTHFAEHIHPEDREAVTQGFTRVVEGRADPYPTECRLVGADGSIHPVAVDAFPMLDALDHVVSYQGIIIDLADRAHMGGPELRCHEALREAAVPYFELETDGSVSFANPAALALLGVGRDDAVGAPFDELVACERESSAYRAFLEVASGRVNSAGGLSEVRTAEGRARSLNLLFLGDGPKAGSVERVLVLANAAGGEVAAGRGPEGRYEAFIERFPYGYAEFDLGGTALRVNGKAARITGYSQEELVGMSFRDLVVPDEVDRAEGELALALTRPDDAVRRYHVRRKDGSPVAVEVNAVPFMKDGVPAGFQLAIVDVSEHARAEEALRESESRFKRLFEHSNDAIFIHTMDGKMLEVNGRACEMLGYGRDELLAMTTRSLHPEESLADSRRAHAEVEQKGSVRFESKFLRSDGSTINVEISSRIIDPERGTIQGVVHDITGRKAVEKALRNSEQTWRSLAENTPNIVIITDRDGTIR